MWKYSIYTLPKNAFFSQKQHAKVVCLYNINEHTWTSRQVISYKIISSYDLVKWHHNLIENV